MLGALFSPSIYFNFFYLKIKKNLIFKIIINVMLYESHTTPVLTSINFFSLFKEKQLIHYHQISNNEQTQSTVE